MLKLYAILLSTACISMAVAADHTHQPESGHNESQEKSNWRNNNWQPNSSKQGEGSWKNNNGHQNQEKWSEGSSSGTPEPRKTSWGTINKPVPKWKELIASTHDAPNGTLNGDD